MKIKEDFVLRKVVENWVVLPLGERTVDFSGMLTLNDSGALLWKTLEQDCDLEALVSALTSEYNVCEDQARKDAQEFVEKLSRVGCLDLQKL